MWDTVQRVNPEPKELPVVTHPAKDSLFAHYGDKAKTKLDVRIEKDWSQKQQKAWCFSWLCDSGWPGKAFTRQRMEFVPLLFRRVHASVFMYASRLMFHGDRGLMNLCM
jgi:hypothetical protein